MPFYVTSLELNTFATILGREEWEKAWVSVGVEAWH